MSVDSAVAELIATDYQKGNVLRLAEWAEKFPDCLEMIERQLGVKVLVRAIEHNQWRLMRYVLTCPRIPFNDLQMLSVSESEHPFCRKASMAILQGKPEHRLEVLQKLQGQVDVL